MQLALELEPTCLGLQRSRGLRCDVGVIGPAQISTGPRGAGPIQRVLTRSGGRACARRRTRYRRGAGRGARRRCRPASRARGRAGRGIRTRRGRRARARARRGSGRRRRARARRGTGRGRRARTGRGTGRRQRRRYRHGRASPERGGVLALQAPQGIPGGLAPQAGSSLVELVGVPQASATLAPPPLVVEQAGPQGVRGTNRLGRGRRAGGGPDRRLRRGPSGRSRRRLRRGPCRRARGRLRRGSRRRAHRRLRRGPRRRASRGPGGRAWGRERTPSRRPHGRRRVIPGVRWDTHPVRGRHRGKRRSGGGRGLPGQQALVPSGQVQHIPTQQIAPVHARPRHDGDGSQGQTEGLLPVFLPDSVDAHASEQTWFLAPVAERELDPGGRSPCGSGIHAVQPNGLPLPLESEPRHQVPRPPGDLVTGPSRREELDPTELEGLRNRRRRRGSREDQARGLGPTPPATAGHQDESEHQQDGRDAIHAQTA